MKIAINGAGIAGPALAYWLQRAGHQPVLIEKAPAFRTGGYVIDFWGLGYSLAERMGILPAVLAAGYSVREVRLVDAEGRRVGGFDASVFRGPTEGRFTSLRRGDLAAAIFNAVKDKVETIFGDSIVSIGHRDNGATIGLAGGESRDVDLVVGADGLHSEVRALAFGPERDFERDLGYRVAAFTVDGYAPRDELVYVSYSRPGRQVARFALRDDRTVFLFVFAAEAMSAAEPHDLAGRKAVLRDIFADGGWECDRILAAMDGVDDLYFDRVSQIRMDRWSSGRVALIGDAAACASLLAGEGTGLAMVEAYVLAGELHRAGADVSAALSRYEERLRPFIAAKQEAARKFAGAFAPKTELGIAVRNLATRAMAIPALAEFFVGRSIRDDFEQPDYGL
jgi:2-polyprenyl-6-methoxyphenol hydroxylase-like FAD-dependent oxidoreductase